MPLKESSTPWDWFTFWEATSHEQCDVAKRKIQWWCCKWGRAGQKSDRNPIHLWAATPKENMPEIPKEDKECPAGHSSPTQEKLIANARTVCKHDPKFAADRDKCCTTQCGIAAVTNLGANAACLTACKNEAQKVR
jgi:hypothetical protein